MPPEICPNCGALVPASARACPECGSDEHTGWSDQATTQRLELPDEEFDYDEFVSREFEGKREVRRGPQKLWWGVAVALVVLIVLFWLARF